MQDLRSKAMSALVWSVVDTAGAQVIQLVVGIVLARLLLPEQFGLIGMLAIFFGMAQAFLDSGFGKALIQKQNPSHVDTCSIFYFNIFVGAAAAGLLCLAAPWIASFYDEPLLAPLTQFFSLNLIVNSFGLVQGTLMTKRIDFKTQAKITVAASLLSGGVGVALALLGFGVWSLAVQQFLSNVCRTGLLWVFNPWRPSLVFSFQSLKAMFGFGSRMLVAGLLQQFFQNIYQAVIGKVYSAADLGFFTRALSLQQTPTETLSRVIGRVALPVFATIQDDNTRLKRGMRQAVTGMVFLNFPVMLGIAAVAHPLVLVLLTEKWLPCVPYLELLCIVGLFYPLHLVNLQLLVAKGRSDLFLRLSILKHVLQVVALVVAVPLGIEAILWGRIVLTVICYAINSYYTASLVGYTVREQLLDVVPYLGVALLMWFGVRALPHVLILAPIALLAAQVALGIMLFVLLSSLFRLPAYVEGLDTFRRRFAPLG